MAMNCKKVCSRGDRDAACTIFATQDAYASDSNDGHAAAAVCQHEDPVEAAAKDLLQLLAHRETIETDEVLADEVAAHVSTDKTKDSQATASPNSITSPRSSVSPAQFHLSSKHSYRRRRSVAHAVDVTTPKRSPVDQRKLNIHKPKAPTTEQCRDINDRLHEFHSVPLIMADFVHYFPFANSKCSSGIALQAQLAAKRLSLANSRSCAKDSTIQRPLPLRATLSPNPAASPPPVSVKFQFDREYDMLVLWQMNQFQAFTQDVQSTLGAILKKYVGEYSKERRKLHDHELSCRAVEESAAVKCRALVPADNGAIALLENSEKMLQNALQKAMDAAVSVREASHRIEEHHCWMTRELNPTRLELMNLRFSGRTITASAICNVYNPRSILREAMELGAIVRSFIIELSSALEHSEHGVPWPFALKADCSDVNADFIGQLSQSISLPVEAAGVGDSKQRGRRDEEF